MTTAITALSKRVQPDVVGCPGQVVDNAVIDSIIRFCEDTHVMFKTFQHDVLSTDVDDTDNYSVSIDLTDYIEDVRPLLILDFKIDGARMGAEYIELLNVQDDISTLEPQGGKLFTYPDRTHLKFYGLAEVDQVLFLKIAFAPTTSITTVSDDFYDRWHKPIESGAKWELFSMPKKDWTDLALAEYYEGLYNSGVSHAKITKDQGRVKGATRVKSLRWF